MKSARIKIFLEIYLLGILCLTYASCSLDEDVYSSIITETFYKTASDAEKGLLATYGAMPSMYGGPAATLVSDFSADQAYPRAVVGRNSLTLFTLEPTYTVQRSQGRLSESPQQIWTSCYSGIEQANWVLQKLPGVSMDNTRKRQILGEAFFLRAFYFWTLTKNFGEVPVKVTPSATKEDAYLLKSPVKEVYNQIYSDLDSAGISGLPSSSGVVIGRPSNEAISALYAKVALYNEDWSTALAKAEIVINSNNYSLISSVIDLFDYAQKEASRKEMIWSYECDPISPGNGHQLVGLCGPTGSGGVEYAKTSFGSMFAYYKFFQSFDPKDQRRGLLDTTYLNKSGKWVPMAAITPITKNAVLIKKYQDPVSTVGTVRNIPILRLADIYLIAAEAEAQLNGADSKAYGYINAIRHRAGLKDLTPGLNREDFIAAVLQERSWELFAEGDRWYDLTRTNTYMSVIPTATNDVYPTRNIQSKYRFFPIPQDEINANPQLVQNPDWN
ncbi:Starch-binding associating with outer membrane [bacterium A37T11]|nr:Starch-binding associating with outer membrane [bacterium A37T11]